MEIFQGVYLGDKKKASDALYFKHNDISYVLNCTKEIKSYFKNKDKVIQTFTVREPVDLPSREVPSSDSSEVSTPNRPVDLGIDFDKESDGDEGDCFELDDEEFVEDDDEYIDDEMSGAESLKDTAVEYQGDKLYTVVKNKVNPTVLKIKVSPNTSPLKETENKTKQERTISDCDFEARPKVSHSDLGSTNNVSKLKQDDNSQGKDVADSQSPKLESSVQSNCTSPQMLSGKPVPLGKIQLSNTFCNVASFRTPVKSNLSVPMHKELQTTPFYEKLIYDSNIKLPEQLLDQMHDRLKSEDFPRNFISMTPNPQRVSKQLDFINKMPMTATTTRSISLPSSPFSSKNPPMLENMTSLSRTPPAMFDSYHRVESLSSLNSSFVHSHPNAILIPDTPHSVSSQSPTETPLLSVSSSQQSLEEDYEYTETPRKSRQKKEKRKTPKYISKKVEEEIFFSQKIKYKQLPLEDSIEQDIKSYFDEGADFIYNSLVESGLKLKDPERINIEQKKATDTAILVVKPHTENKENVCSNQHSPSYVTAIKVNLKEEETKYMDLRRTVDCSPKSNCLVHCREAKSRSVSMILAFAMKYMRYTLKQAYEHIRKKTNNRTRINDGFKRQLMEYELNLFEGLEKSTKDFFPKRERKRVRTYDYYDDLDDDSYIPERPKKKKKQYSGKKRGRKSKLPSNTPSAATVARMFPVMNKKNIRTDSNNFFGLSNNGSIVTKKKQLTLFDMMKKPKQPKTPVGRDEHKKSKPANLTCFFQKK